MDMMDVPDPLMLVDDYPVAEMRSLVKQLKEDAQKAIDEEESEAKSSHIGILMHVLDSLDKELAKVKKIDQLSTEKQARIIADTCFILQILQSKEDFDEDYEYEGEEYEFEDEDFDEEEDENTTKRF